MAKLQELIYDVRESLKSYSDDTELDDRYIVYLYNIKRAKYLRQDLNNYSKTIDNSIQQSLCLELEEVSANECSLDLDCGTIVRSTKPLPKPLELHTKTALTKIKPTNKLSLPFNFLPKERIYYLIGGSSFPKSVYAFLDIDNHIYITSELDSHKLIECITVQGVFEDPLQLKDFKDCCGCSDDSNICFSEEDTDYPLQPHLVDIIRSEIINELIQKERIPQDKYNNSNDGEKTA